MTHEIEYVPPNEQILEALLTLVQTHAELVSMVRVAATLSISVEAPMGEEPQPW